MTQALENTDGLYAAVLGYDQGALSYYPDLLLVSNTLETMRPRYGYWIKMRIPGTLQYPTTVEEGGAGAGEGSFEIGARALDMGHPDSLISSIRQVEHRTGIHSTPTWVNFFGPAHREDGTPLPVGTTVLALDPDGVACGATMVTTEGYYGLLPCYGDDSTTPEDEGAQGGDVIRLVVDGDVLGEGIWTAHGERQRVALGDPGSNVSIVYMPLIVRAARQQ